MTQSLTKTYHHYLTYRARYFFDNDSYPTGGPTHGFQGQGTSGDNADTIIAFGANYPDWRDRIRLGQNATTTLSGTVQRVLNSKEGYYHAKWVMVPNGFDPSGSYEKREDTGFGYLGISSPIFYPNPGLEFISLNTATNRALAKYNEKVALVNRQFQGGVFFGEIAEALHGIRHPAEALFKGIEKYSTAATKLRRSYVKSKADYLSKSKSQRRQVAKAFTSAATGLWLERSFHWIPLVGDISGAISALQHTFDSIPTHMVRSSYEDVQAKTVTYGSYVGPIQYSGSKSTTISKGASVRFYGKVRVGPRTTFVPDKKALGFDLQSFVPTLWELIPYSWAVDYFTNVGDIIYGASQGGSDVMWTAMGTKAWAIKSQLGFIDPTPPVPTTGWHFRELSSAHVPSEVTTESALLTRQPYNGNYIPGLEYKVPGMSLKWLNLGAAFLQRSLAFL